MNIVLAQNFFNRVEVPAVLWLVFSCLRYVLALLPDFEQLIFFFRYVPLLLVDVIIRGVNHLSSRQLDVFCLKWVLIFVYYAIGKRIYVLLWQPLCVYSLWFCRGMGHRTNHHRHLSCWIFDLIEGQNVLLTQSLQTMHLCEALLFVM